MRVLHDSEHATPCDREARDAFDVMMQQLAREMLVVAERVAASRGVMMCGDASEQDSMRKKAGGGSALSHACDSQRVCDTRADARETPASSETHTTTHTDDATRCKHDGYEQWRWLHRPTMHTGRQREGGTGGGTRAGGRSIDPLESPEQIPRGIKEHT